TGRDATKAGSNIVDITGSRTNLTTATLSIANSAATEEGPASTALQLTEETVTMNSDMLMDGGVRPSLDVDKNDEYNIYLSDNEEDDPAGFDEVYNYGSYNFYTYEVTGGGYDWIASFHDGRVVPLTSQYAYMMLNGDGEETAIPQDAYVVVFYHWGDINVWPLRQLDNFKVSFALTDFNKPSDAIYGGNAENYVRLNVTISSKEAYGGCRVILGGQQVYTAKVETSQGATEVEPGGSQEEFEVVFGETVTLAVTQVPDGQVFDSWRCNGRRYTDSVLHLPITQMETEIYPVFKDKSPVLWVQNDFKPGNPNVILDGSENAPYKTIAEAFAAIPDDDNTLRGWRINVLNADENEVIDIDELLGQKVKYITISNESDDEMWVAGMNVSADVPVVVRYFGFAPVEGPIQETDEVENVITLSGRRLTLDNCEIQGGERNRGAMVNSGELVLINTYVNSCSAGDNGDGGGVYVAEGATLSLKNESSISGNIAQNGNDVYLCGGATLNVSNSYIGEEEEKENDDVYAASESSFNVSSSLIANVNLADGAFVSANLELNRDKRMRINFSKIATPTSKVVEIKGKIDERFEHELQYFLRESFIITDENLLDKDYSQYLKFDGNIGYPFITKKIYSTGTITLMAPEQIDVYYTYYRGEDEEEYLRLKYNWDDSDYECHNYWLIGGKVCCDTIQAICGLEYPIANASDLSVFGTGYSWPDAWDNYGFDRTDDFKNLLTVNTEGRSVDDDGNIVDNENEVIAELNKNVIANCNNDDLFKSILPGFRSLIQRSICIEGRNKIDDAQIEQWTSGNTYFGDDVNDYEIETEEDNDFANYSLWEIEEHFDKLRDGFDVTIMALGGKVTDGEGNTYTGVKQKKLPFGTVLELTAGDNFIGWSDGFEYATRTFVIRGDVEIMPIFKQTEFTVSAGGPYKSFDLINKVIEKCDADDDVVINVNGTVKGSQTLSSNINVHSITIQGNDDDIPDVLNGNQLGRVLTINTTSPVTIKNLTITGGKANVNDYDVNDEDDENNFGGGIMMTEGTIVTLADGAVVGKAGVSKVATDNNYANFAGLRGGGIYNQGGTLTLESGSMVSYNYVKIYSIYNSTSTTGGAGIYSRGGEVIIEDGAEVMYNYSNSRGGGIHLDAGAKLTSSGKIDNNEADFYGGGVMFATYDGSNTDMITLYESTTFTMEGGSVSNNKTTKGDLQNWGASGGGIFIDGGGTATIKAGLINGNSAPYNGGAIRIARGTLDLQGGTMEGNYLSWHEVNYCQGGAIGMNTSNCTFKISGNVYIPCTGIRKNDIYLDNGEFITIAGKLTPPAEANGIVATITPQTYDAENPVLQLATDKTTLANECGKFAVMPDEKNYAVDYEGKLREVVTYGDKNYPKYSISGSSKLADLFGVMNANAEFNTQIYISIDNDLELTNHIPFEVEVRINENDWKTVGFKGVFDGNGHTITINSFDNSYTWGNNMKNVNTLVCYRNEGIIQNVIVKGTCTNNIASGQHVDAGGLCYCNAGGIIRNCWNKMSFDLKILHQTGGICAINEGLIENCINTGTIKAAFNTTIDWEGMWGFAGGICGENITSDPGVHANGVIKNCVNYGTVEIQTKYNTEDGTDGAGINGAGGAICAINGQKSSKQGATYPTIEYCYWLENCVKTGSDISTATNYMVYNDSRVRFGTATGCGYFANAANGALTAGSAEDCGSVQTLSGDVLALLNKLNEYVTNSNNGNLKQWKVGDNQAAVLNFGN
ncbi:MAG: hypothetical protein J6X32_05990, partial [Salinivirgaceae bacterium]|nr:hypothetical protein [Salinivirgaceae bacterium]